MDNVILHCDLNNFYASVECLYRPEIRDKPVAVCGSEELRHGIVLAKNYIAKRFGVITGESIREARNKCSELIVVPPNYQLYLRFSRDVREIYKTYTDMVEAFGIDENWLDVTESSRLFGDGVTIANQIRKRIKNEMGVTISVGVSFNKIFAKLGSDLKKPDAVTPIPRENFKEIVWGLPVKELLYVGPSTRRKLNKVGIYTIGHLANAPLKFIVNHLGKWGETLWYFANGYDTTPVAKMSYEASIKGIGNSLTAPRDLVCNEDVKALIYVLAESVGERLRRHQLQGKTVQIYIRDNELNHLERQGQLYENTYITSEIAQKAYEIFLNHWSWNKNIRSFGVRVTNLIPAGGYIQQSIFENGKRYKRETIDQCIDDIRGRFGHYSVQRALLLKESKLNANPVEENVIHPVPYFR